MKIEMGESLFYSWFRHVKECQIVQTNWKVSQQWEMKHDCEIDEILAELKEYFERLSVEQNVVYPFFEKAERSQIIKQGECDVLGVNIHDGELTYYAADVAFHAGGLDYGKKYETVTKVIEKCVRTALCLYGYFDTKAADVIFASPKINDAVLIPLKPLMEYLNTYFASKGFRFNFRLICNEGFGDEVIEPILLVGGDIVDTGELFMRAYTLLTMFEKQKEKAEQERDKGKRASKKSKKSAAGTKTAGAEVDAEAEVASSNDGKAVADPYAELKVGQIARTVLREVLESGDVSDKEITDMQTLDYSKETFGINFPLLSTVRKERYYASPLTINGTKYYMCSEWFETDRPYLTAWLNKHKGSGANGQS